ncbi:MAG TPA: cobalamin biosynthesis protein [Candidatus Nitrosopolaris sp.]|nr:cobalamin biosynthesis protein [Candidatus Nitrosopolaris sp.]
MTRNIAVIAITRHGIDIANNILKKMPEVQVYAPIKYANQSMSHVNWFGEQTSQLVANLFKKNDALICVFSLGAVIRLIAPFLVDKKTDPAVVVIDDKAQFVISALSGHLGGANSLARLVASFFDNCQPVITTAADVNDTIAVDLLGREFSWTIENFENVTKVSALMVNEEQIGVYQEAGEKDWWQNKSLPSNVTVVRNLEDLKSSQFKGALVISDRIINDQLILAKSVVYRPKSLVVGIGIHRDTVCGVVEDGVKNAMKNEGLSFNSIRNIASISREAGVKGLQDFSSLHGIPVEVYDRIRLGLVPVPNPSETVKRFEGTPSVSEASAILSAKGDLVVPKQKYPPDLTVAVARVRF